MTITNIAIKHTPETVLPSDQEQGPKFWLDIEGDIKPWEKDTITTEEVIDLGGWDPQLGAIIIDKKTNEERTLQPGEVIELKPGMGFSKKVKFIRGEI